MSQDTARIGRLVAEEIGACCGGDVEERLADAGLVERRKRGTSRSYRSTGRAERIVATLDATRGGG